MICPRPRATATLQAQCSPVKRVSAVPSGQAGRIHSASTAPIDPTPNTVPRIRPGIRKSLNGEYRRTDNGIDGPAPDGLLTSMMPPNSALTPRKMRQPMSQRRLPGLSS
ncbi:hypothetical protein FNU79_17265 [Deinococcus detaillensis]|uniref:Uncharacterized protein n=1 Tax=Deinococcus detaillensis TaxID=2592048 RepID=A0A553UI99_9DEIO|nr:hypothetical protein FNU79_17265 [Deinococcus detaillensis]